MACSPNYAPCSDPRGNADINGWPVRYTDCNQLNVYAARVTGNNSKFLQVVIASLSTNRITYCKARAGDCGSPGYAVGGGTTAAAYGLAKAASADPEPISATATHIVSQILGIFGAAHAQAVANEQATICRVADGWNQWSQSIEADLQSGRINIQDAVSQLRQVYQALSNTLAAAIKTPGDAANYYKAALDALEPFNEEIVFPSLAGSGLLGGAASSLGLTAPAGSPGSVTIGGQTLNAKGLLVAGGAALLIAKLLGLI